MDRARAIVSSALLVASLAACGGGPVMGSLDAGACEPGTLGCECALGDVCGATSTGQALVCDRGLCRIDCTLGETACACEDGACHDAADECLSDGYCRPLGCDAGQESCPCLAGTCGAGLYCIRERSVSGTCVDDTGYPGGACPEEGLCRQQSRCDAASGTCVPCALGSAGCIPDGARCNEGLVLTAGRCVAPAPERPTDPQCYTRCRADLVESDGTVRRCDAEGLLAGCVGDFVCMDGSCAPPDAIPPACTDDTACPDFQHCIAGGCFSDCERDAECRDGRICHHRVCRAPCDRTALERDACPDGSFCDSESGIGGVCMPLVADPSSEAHTEITASYELSRDTVQLSSGAGSFGLLTDSLSRESFTIRRISHRAYDRDGSLVAEADAREGDTPLAWLELAYEGATSREPGFAVTIEPGCEADCPAISIRSVDPLPFAWARWEGTLEVMHARLGPRYLQLSFAAGLDGVWTGTMHYFANFAEEGLRDWRLSADRSDARGVRNALIRRWAAFRRGDLTGGFDELQAVLASTETGSWQWPTIESACATVAPSGACYPYAGGSALGIQVYASNTLDAPIPTASTSLPVSMNLRSSPGDATRLEGRIDSAASLHYGGDPAIAMQFDGDPTDPAVCGADRISTNCVAFLRSLSATVLVGGRYPVEGEPCASGFSPESFPWLVPGFHARTTFDSATGMAWRTECRDTRVPLTGAGVEALNASLAGANPIPDGRVRQRTLHAVDGALVDSETLFVLFEERFESVWDRADTEGFSAYGYMLLSRVPADLVLEDFVGSTPVTPPDADPRLGVACDPALLGEVLDGATLTSTNAAAAVTTLLTGERRTGAATIDPSRVHYYCQDTGLFDGGRGERGDPLTDVRVACPAGSNVAYFAFTATTAPTQAQIADLPCQGGYDPASSGRATCGGTLDAWRTAGRTDMLFDVLWTCSGDATYCNRDRADLRSGRTFFSSGEVLFVPLEPAIEDAFRYKVRFRSAGGRSTGFAPAICDPASDLVPYCYDPDGIEEIRARVDCAMDIYRRFPGANADGRISAFLSQSLSYAQTIDPRYPAPLIEDGFERLYAELLIMLGDDSLTNAYRSRFDSAATRAATFRGSLFEPSGIDLSGVAGYEMHSLYQAAQYYQTALDRFYDLGPVIYTALQRGDVGAGPPSAITPGLVTWYIERLVRGSAQKSRAWAEIAERYQELNRPDLARRVLERAFTASYLESIVLSRLMLRIADASSTASRAEIEREVERAQDRYGVSLSEMREVYTGITDAVTHFGFPLDYVPFPVRDDSDFRASNAFEDVLRTTREFVDTARRHEDEAISSARSFDTDTVSFQSELVRIGRSYEERVGPLCGYFVGTDGRTYPAIARYAQLDERATTLGNPCGLMGNGAIHQQIGVLQRYAQQHNIQLTRLEHLRQEMADEAERVDRQCGLIGGIAAFEYQRGTEVLSLEQKVRNTSLAINHINTGVSILNQMLSLATSNSPASPSAIAIIGTSSAAALLATDLLQARINNLQTDMTRAQLDTARWRTERQCDAIRIDSDILMRAKLRQLLELELEAEQLTLDYRLAESELRRMLLESQRIEEQREEAEQLALDVEAVRNDPNVRLFRNDAILNADRSFSLAMRHVYRTTRVFEYYTSQSYAGLDRLFLIRMVARGEDNLERYLLDLQHAFLLWEEAYRAPARRVRRLSLRDDIFQIPFQDDQGRELSQADRNRLMRERLTDPMLLDRNGHLAVPFRTGAEDLSPCTRNHKLDWIEVQLIGSDLGDDQAEVRLWQEGTGVIESLGEGTQYYRLPEALMVVNPYFGRNQIFDPAVYRRYEFRERPFINTAWSLVLDQRDTRINQDLDLNQLTDMVVYLYYTDFTDAAACR